MKYSTEMPGDDFMRWLKEESHNFYGNFRDLDKKHKSHLYTGLQGFFMKYGHKKLEDFKKKK